jgi:hypothetical protein
VVEVEFEGRDGWVLREEIGYESNFAAVNHTAIGSSYRSKECCCR